ncbi:hypothetical protein ABW19_dt0210612 [Dactylella cylindrospora]|nr:hypothetical protein ABW19_dt0210612 [Dactylella cylindrospora]
MVLDINETEIVSRKDLIPPKSPERPSQQVDWSSILGYTIDLDDNQGDVSLDSTHSRSQTPQDENSAEVEFRLFAPTNDSDKVQKYILPPSPPPELAIPGALTDDLPQIVYFTDKDVETAHSIHRPQYYYLTPPLEEDEGRFAQIRVAAVSGEQILEASKERWKGCELPWRVTKLTIAHKAHLKRKDGQKPSRDGLEAVPSEGESRKRHRPNKKRRIILRKRRSEKEKEIDEAKKAKNAIKKKNKKKKAEVGKAVESVQTHKRTEEEDREKRTRLNRLKKIRRKRKMKEKAAGEQVPTSLTT